MALIGLCTMRSMVGHDPAVQIMITLRLPTIILLVLCVMTTIVNVAIWIQYLHLPKRVRQMTYYSRMSSLALLVVSWLFLVAKVLSELAIK